MSGSGVEFIGGGGASEAFRGIGERLVDEFGGLPSPPTRRFRSRLGAWLYDFELARLEHSSRFQVARRAAQLFVGQVGLGGTALLERLLLPLGSGTGEFARLDGKAAPRLDLRGPFGCMPSKFARRMASSGECSLQAEVALSALERNVSALDLRGQAFVLLGAAAELSPARLLLEAGADVVWVDLRPPTLDVTTFAGSLFYLPGGGDLLRNPGGILQSLQGLPYPQFHLGLYAYAAGRAHEWALCAVMNSLTERLRARLSSVSLLMSPASISTIYPMGDVSPPLFLAALGRLKGAVRSKLAQGVVPQQGAGYQAAQYLGKRLTVEAWSQEELVSCVSANLAPITRTRSLNHRLFEVAFRGAHRVGVRIFETEDTAHLMGLLMLSDLLRLCPAADPGACQIHGGVLGLPVSLADAITVALVSELARRPWSLLS